VACSSRWRDENSYKIFVDKNLKGRGHSEDQDVDEKIILEWILGKYFWKV